MTMTTFSHHQLQDLHKIPMTESTSRTKSAAAIQSCVLLSTNELYNYTAQYNIIGVGKAF